VTAAAAADHIAPASTAPVAGVVVGAEGAVVDLMLMHPLLLLMMMLLLLVLMATFAIAVPRAAAAHAEAAVTHGCVLRSNATNCKKDAFDRTPA
jgi:hypothetical protein